jgi:hypothetical protein
LLAAIFGKTLHAASHRDDSRPSPNTLGGFAMTTNNPGNQDQNNRRDKQQSQGNQGGDRQQGAQNQRDGDRQQSQNSPDRNRDQKQQGSDQNRDGNQQR